MIPYFVGGRKSLFFALEAPAGADADKEAKMTLETLFSRYPAEKEYLVEALRDYLAEKDDHSVTEGDIIRFAAHFGVTESKVCNVVSFYTYLSADPKGRFVVRVCGDVPCFVNGSESVLKTVEEKLGIRPGEVTPDGRFSLESTPCLGHCDHAPCLRINEVTHHDLTPEKIRTILAGCGEAKP